MQRSKKKSPSRARSLKLRTHGLAGAVIGTMPAPEPPHVCHAKVGSVRCETCFQVIGPRLLDTLSSADRKEYPMSTGLHDYFPDALADVSHVSWMGNEKHNPGQPLHHARGKSNDHADCCQRHLDQRGGFDTIVINGVERKVRHSTALAWRALALCQQEIEEDLGLPLPRGASI